MAAMPAAHPLQYFIAPLCVGLRANVQPVGSTIAYILVLLGVFDRSCFTGTSDDSFSIQTDRFDHAKLPIASLRGADCHDLPYDPKTTQPLQDIETGREVPNSSGASDQ